MKQSYTSMVRAPVGLVITYMAWMGTITFSTRYMFCPLSEDMRQVGKESSALCSWGSQFSQVDFLLFFFLFFSAHNRSFKSEV